MITSVRYCLSIDLLNVIFLPSKFVYLNENLNSVSNDVMTLFVPTKSIM